MKKKAPRKRKNPAGLAPDYWPALTGLRAFAAVLVLMHHFYGQWFINPGMPGDLWREGYVGVSIFFTLSGFLISRTYYSKIVSREIGFGTYWLRRFARVYPAYWALLLVKFIFQPAAATSTAQVIANLTLLQGMFSSFMWSGLAPAWSLTIEESFYLLAPSVFLALGWFARKPPFAARFFKKRLPLQRFTVLAAIAGGLWLLGDLIHWVKPGGDFLSSEMNIRVYNIFGRFTEFGIGVFAGLTIDPRKKTKFNPETAFLGGIALIGVSLMALKWSAQAWQSNYGVYSPVGHFAEWFASLGTASIIWGTVKGSDVSRLLLGNRLSEYLGRISYVFYLVQDRFFAEKFFGTTSAPSFFAMALGLGVLSAVIYQGIEKPMHSAVLELAARFAPKKKKLPA